MGMGFAPTWLRQMIPHSTSHDQCNHWVRIVRPPAPTLYPLAALLFALLPVT